MRPMHMTLATLALWPFASLSGQTGTAPVAAQRAAYGRPGSTTLRIAGENVTYEGGRLVETRFGPVLVAEGRVRDFSAISPGRVGAFYLKRTAGGFARGRAYPSAVVGGTMGGIGAWGITTRFGTDPVIYAEGGPTNQGITCSYTTLVELTAAGPVRLAEFQSFFGSNGAVGRRAETKGVITHIVPDRSFDVVYAGSRPGRAHYVRRGTAYRLAGAPGPLAGC